MWVIFFFSRQRCAYGRYPMEYHGGADETSTSQPWTDLVDNGARTKFTSQVWMDAMTKTDGLNPSTSQSTSLAVSFGPFASFDNNGPVFFGSQHNQKSLLQYQPLSHKFGNAAITIQRFLPQSNFQFSHKPLLT